MLVLNKKILIISFSPIARDPRVLRQILILKDLYYIYLIGYGNGLEVDVFRDYTFAKRDNSLYQKIVKGFFLFCRQFEKAFWTNNNIKTAYKILKEEKEQYDLIIANEIDSLPLAFRIGNGAPVLFDAHEYYPGQFTDRILKRIISIPLKKYLCEIYIPIVSAMTTVCQSIADEYKRVYKKNVTVITNAPFYEPFEPLEPNESRIRIIHHGGANPSRNIETMIKVMQYLDNRFTFDLILMPTNKKYYKKIVKMVSGEPSINMLEPVATIDIAKKINEYDIGLFILAPNNFNYKYALPNKLFEFIQARLCVVIGPSPEMAKIVKKYNLGIVADSFEPLDIANILNALTNEDVFRYKLASDRAAKELNAENNSKILEAIIDNLIQTANKR
jgi:hypothetical protein